jgi:hypothetical protein
LGHAVAAKHPMGLCPDPYRVGLSDPNPRPRSFATSTAGCPTSRPAVIGVPGEALLAGVIVIGVPGEALLAGVIGTDVGYLLVAVMVRR